MIASVATHGVNWELVGTIVGIFSPMILGVGKLIARKVDQVGEHLKHQDERGNRTEARIMRLEEKAGLPPLHFEGRP